MSSPHLSNIFLLFTILLPLASSVQQIQVINPVILIDEETLNYKLNEYFSGMNVTYSLGSTPQNNVTITQAFTNNTAVQNYSDTNVNFIATYLDPENFIYLATNNSVITLYHYQISPSSEPNLFLSQNLSINGVTCFNVIPWEDSYVVTCASSQNNLQTTSYTLFNRTSGLSSNFTTENYSTGMNRVMAMKSKVFSSPDGDIIVSYIPSNMSVTSNQTIITFLNISNASSPATFSPVLKFSPNSRMFSIEIVNDNLYIVAYDGSVYLSSLLPGPQITTVNKISNVNTVPVFSTSIQNANGNLMTICSSNNVFYFNNWQMVSSFSTPSGFIINNCISDGRFVFVTGTTSNNPSVLVYSTTELFSANYLSAIPLQVMPANLQISDILGLCVLITPQNIVWSQINYPSITFQATSSSETVNLTISDNTNTIQALINLTILPNDPSQIYSNVQNTLSGLNGLILDLSQNFIAAGVEVNSAFSNFTSATVETITPVCDLNFTFTYNTVQVIPGSIYNIDSNVSTITFLATDSSGQGNISFIQASRQFKSGCPIFYDFDITNYTQKTTGCVPGSVFTICIIQGQLFYISQQQGIQFFKISPCTQLELFDPVYYPTFVAACILGPVISFFDINSNFLYQINITQLMGDTNNITSLAPSPSSQEIIYISTLNNIYTFSLPFLANPNNEVTAFMLSTFQSSFNLTGIVASLSSVVTYNINQNVMAEWDVSDVINPYFRRNLNLAGLTLNQLLGFTTDSNLLYLQASNENGDYLLVVKPGLQGFNYLTYINSFEPSNVLTIATQPTEGTDIFIQYYPFTATITMIFPIPRVIFSLSTPNYEKLNVSAEADLNLQSILANPTNFTFGFNYLQPEQEIKIQPYLEYNSTGFIIREGVEISSSPNYYFLGNPLDYTLENYVLDGAIAINYQFPLNYSNSFQVNTISGVGQNQNITDVISSSDNLYILLYNGVLQFNTSVNGVYTPIGSQHSGNCTFGDTLNNNLYQVYICLTDPVQNVWNLWLMPVGLTYTITDEVLDVKIRGNGTIFVLSGSNPVTLYILQPSPNMGQINLVTTMNLVTLGLNLIPTGFDVMNLTSTVFLVQFFNGEDIIYFASVNLNGLPPYQITPYFLLNATSLFITDLPSENIQIIGGTIMQASYVNDSMTAEIFLNIANFHSYEMLIQFNITQNSISSVNISRCFLQTSGAMTMNYYDRTNNYLLIVKEYSEKFYLYSYPLNNTVTTNQTTKHIYNVPIQRMFLSSNNSFFKFAATNGNISTIFMAANGNGYYNTSVNIYNATLTFQIGYNPNVSIRSFADLTYNFTYLNLSNDISNNFGVQFNLVIPFDILTASYFIIFTGIFTLLFICAFICFARKYKQAKKTLQLTEYFLDNENN